MTDYSDEAKDQAIATIARQIVSSQFEDEWEDWPLIGEHDWEVLLNQVRRVRVELRPPPEAVAEAYRLLADRASKDPT